MLALSAAMLALSAAMLALSAAMLALTAASTDTLNSFDAVFASVTAVDNISYAAFALSNVATALAYVYLASSAAMSAIDAFFFITSANLFAALLAFCFAACSAAAAAAAVSITALVAALSAIVLYTYCISSFASISALFAFSATITAIDFSFSTAPINTFEISVSVSDTACIICILNSYIFLYFSSIVNSLITFLIYVKCVSSFIKIDIFLNIFCITSLISSLSN